MDSIKKNTKVAEFVVLLAMIMSLVALSIDAMLPALGQIGLDLGVTSENKTQLIISTIFLGMSFGIIFFGPYSDSFGRKKAVYLGISIFLIGCLVSMLADNFELMLFGRVLQGFGGASCRIVSLAMVRDRFSGNKMAKVMSLIMVIFVIVPALAPAIGQLILWIGHWRQIFGLFLVMGVTCILWMALRQEETLAPENKRAFSPKVILSGVLETIHHPVARAYTLAAGILFGSFIGYLSSSRQILQVQYELGEWFPLSFATLAITIGISSFLNSKLVMKFSMERLTTWALTYITVLSGLFLLGILLGYDDPSLAIFMTILILMFCGIGILFGNLNAMAVEPLGHIAGVANSVIGSIQTLISVGIGAYIGNQYDGTVKPLIAGFFVCSLMGLAIVLLTKKQKV